MAHTKGTRIVYWYAPHRGLSRPSAVRSAIAAADNPEAYDMITLFKGLHVAAWHIRKPRDPDAWLPRWKRIHDHIGYANLGLPCTMLFRLRTRLDDEIESVANNGLARAIDRFDPWRGLQFSTYACNVIYREIARFIKRRNRSLESVQFEEYHEPCEFPLHHESALKMAMHEVYCRIQDVITDPRERIIIAARFLADGRPMTLKELGKSLGCSKERVRQIQTIGMERIRAAVVAELDGARQRCPA